MCRRRLRKSILRALQPGVRFLRCVRGLGEGVVLGGNGPDNSLPFGARDPVLSESRRAGARRRHC